MTALPQPPPEAALIRTAREAPPHLPIRQAAHLAGISESRWRQLEAGGKPYRGRWEPEIASAGTLARMARAVGVTDAQLTLAGRGDAAGELSVLPAEPDVPADRYEDLKQQLARLEAKLDRALGGREPAGEEDDLNEPNGSRRAG